MGIVTVPLGNRSYNIKIGIGLLARLGAECARLGLGTRCAIISDTREPCKANVRALFEAVKEVNERAVA